jgi:hypothetical protein
MINKLKKFILTRQFVLDSFEEYFETRKEKIYQKAFADARKDLEETNIYDVDEKSKELCKQKLNDLLSNVEMHKIVSLDKTKGILFIGGVKADEGRLANLKAEAEFLDKSDIWQLMQETPKELAQRAMFVEGESLDNMKKGRSILYTLSTQKNILDILKSYVGKPKPPATPNKSP